jgi:hypothetical protein
MNSKKYLIFIALASIFALSSCSGFGDHCTVNCGGGGGTATLTITLRATPLTPQASTNLLAFVTSLTGVSITPTSGNPVNLNSTPTLDFVRLQSNSLLIGTVSVPTGSYTGITMSFAAPAVTYCTQTTPGLAGCSSGTVKTVNGGVSAPQIPLTLTLSANQQAGVEIDLNTANTLTVANQVVSAVNLGAVNAFTASTLPPTASSLGNGQLDFFENVLGVVTAVSGQAVTVATSNYGTFTATGSATTYYEVNCVLQNVACAPAVGQLVSLDAAVNPDGSLALLTFDPLSNLEIDWVDGVVTTTQTNSTQFQIVAGDQATAEGGASALPNGSIVNVTLSNPFPFYIDSKGLPIPANTFLGSTDATNILPGMTVGIHVTAYTAASGNTPAAITADVVTLRYSYVSGAVFTVAPPNTFSLASLPSFFGLTGNSVVQLSSVSPDTNYDGVTGPSGLVVGHTVGISGLYFGPNAVSRFVTSKVRQF